MDVGKIWDKVRDKEAGDAEFARADPDFRAKLAHAAGVVRQGDSTGIAGLEKFEEAVKKEVEKEGGPERKEPSGSNVDAALVDGSGQARSSGGVQPEDIGLQPQDAEGAKSVKETPKGSGQQDAEPMTEERALESAAAAGSRVEASAPHSPSAPSAARPLAAEAPGNRPTGDEAKAAAKTSVKRSKAAASKSSKKAAKKASK